MVPEADLKETDSGLVPASAGWFVLNARDARWFDKPGQGFSLPLTGNDEHEAETFFPMLGMSIRVMHPGEPSTTYHWETEQEDFLVLAGEALLIVEGQERVVRQWDFVHCPPHARHTFVGAGDGPCARARGSSRRTGRGAPTASTRPRPASTRRLPRTRRTRTPPMRASSIRGRPAARPGCWTRSHPGEPLRLAGLDPAPRSV